MVWKEEFMREFKASFTVSIPIALLNTGRRNAVARPFIKANLIIFFLTSLSLE